MGYTDPTKQRAFAQKWMAKRRAEGMAALGPCVRCGSLERIELHHKNPAEKVSHRIWSWTAEKRAAELAKCEPLCHACHHAETVASLTIDHPHGTRGRYGKGCRCRPCKDANARAGRKFAAAHRINIQAAAAGVSSGSGQR